MGRVGARMAKKRLFSKAQISMEYLMIVSFALAMTLPLLLIFNDQSVDINNELSANQANKAADELIIAIDSVYYLGPPAQRTVKIYFPNQLNDVTVENHSFSFLMESPGGDYEVVRWTNAPLDGTLRNYTGIHVITITANENNVTIDD